MSPNKEVKDKDSECDSGEAHTQIDCAGVRSPGAAGSSPFGIYPVEDAVGRLSVVDDPVPRSYIEHRARELTNCGGMLANGSEVTARSFVAHCLSWWENERCRSRYLAGASAANSSGGIPLARGGEEQKAYLCSECGCVHCRDGHICEKGYIPPAARGGSDACRPDERLVNGRYRCGCFVPGGAS